MSLPDSRNAEKELDDILLAMDVVDTLRHSSRVVERELDTVVQDAQLLERLRTIYAAQGLVVPDHILREGVTALREDRFAYKPAPPSLSRHLAEWYVNNQKLTPFVIYGALLLLFVVVASLVLSLLPVGVR